MHAAALALSRILLELDDISAFVRMFRTADAEHMSHYREGALASLGEGLPRPGVNLADVLTAVAALTLVRIEDLDGDDAMAELARQARGQDHASS